MVCLLARASRARVPCRPRVALKLAYMVSADPPIALRQGERILPPQQPAIARDAETVVRQALDVVVVARMLPLGVELVIDIARMKVACVYFRACTLTSDKPLLAPEQVRKIGKSADAAQKHLSPPTVVMHVNVEQRRCTTRVHACGYQHWLHATLSNQARGIALRMGLWREAVLHLSTPGSLQGALRGSAAVEIAPFAPRHRARRGSSDRFQIAVKAFSYTSWQQREARYEAARCLAR